MKKISLVIAALAAAFAVSCTKEAPETQLPQDQNVPAGMKMVTITASIEGADTKTSYDAAGKFSWTKGDKISVLASDGNLYTFSTQDSQSQAKFSGYLPEGCSLGDYALFPAEEGHVYNAAEYYPVNFLIPSYKDLTNNGSADLPLHGIKGESNAFAFQHMTGGFKFTIDNFDDRFKTAEVSVVNSSLKISGLFQGRKSSTHSGYVTYATTTTEADELTYVRKLKIVNNKVELYFPYSPGNDLWGTTTITISGYDNEDNRVQLLSKNVSFGGKSHARATIIPVATLPLPKYIPAADLSSVDWNAENVATVTNDPASADAILEELKAVADNNYMYVRIKSAHQTPYGGNFIDILLSDGDAEAEGAAMAWDQWPGTLGIDLYKKEHKGTIDAEGNITSMTFNHNGTYENIEFKNEIIDGKITWYMIFPVDYMEKYKSPTGTVHVGFRLWTDWANFAAIPARGWGQSMLEVTLP